MKECKLTWNCRPSKQIQYKIMQRNHNKDEWKELGTVNEGHFLILDDPNYRSCEYLIKSRYSEDIVTFTE